MKKIYIKVFFLFIILSLTVACQKPAAIDDITIDEVDVDEVTVKQPIVEELVVDEITSDASTTLATYNGLWFEVKYPENFTASPSYQADEAYFLSPDQTVEFFVYSPQWTGNPENYLNVSPTEELVSESTDDTGTDYEHKVVKWATIKAKDGSYLRSYVSIKEQVGTGSDLHHVFGIKYKDEASYQKYTDAYIAFKDSLQQFAD